MTREFHVVSPEMWSDERFLALPDDAKLLWARLLTGPEVSVLPGLIVAGRLQLAETMGWSPRKFDRAFEALSTARPGDEHPMALADWRARVVALPRAPWHRRRPKNPNEVTSWRDSWKVVPDCDLKRLQAGIVRSHLCQLGDGLVAAFDNITSSKYAQPLGSAALTTSEQLSNRSDELHACAPARARSDSHSLSESPPEIAREPESDVFAVPDWWSDVVATVQAIPVPVEGPREWWFEYAASMHRKHWTPNRTHAVGWLTSAARKARDGMRRAGSVSHPQDRPSPAHMPAPANPTAMPPLPPRRARDEFAGVTPLHAHRHGERKT